MLNRSYLKVIVTLSLILPLSSVLAMPITHSVTIQPIVVSDDDGSNTATFFGSLNQKSSIETLIDSVWGQAGIDVNFLNATSWNNSFVNNGDENPRPGIDLNLTVNAAEDAGKTHENLDFINIFFVNTAAGFSLKDDSHVAGFAFINNNGISQFVGSDLLSFGQQIIADVVAHEIGHNLGLVHTEDGINNLMSPNGIGNTLTSDQIAIVLNSNFAIEADVTTIPVPAAVWLFGSGLIGLVSFSRKKR